MTKMRAPLPGTFYRSPSPDQPPFKKDGDSVKAGDVIGTIEIMKSFHEVRAEADGSSIRFVVENEDTVEPGTVLAEIS